MNREQLLGKLDRAWAAFQQSYEGLPQPEADLTEPGVVGNWSVKDILAHVTTWEEEALRYLPIIIQGGRPAKYSEQYGGLDAFNALKTEEKRNLPVSEVLRQLEETHSRLISYVESVPEEQIVRETPFRHRLRLDTYSHYPVHARMIQEWREEREEA